MPSGRAGRLGRGAGFAGLIPLAGLAARAAAFTGRAGRFVERAGRLTFRAGRFFAIDATSNELSAGPRPPPSSVWALGYGQCPKSQPRVKEITAAVRKKPIKHKGDYRTLMLGAANLRVQPGGSWQRPIMSVMFNRSAKKTGKIRAL